MYWRHMRYVICLVPEATRGRSGVEGEPEKESRQLMQGKQLEPFRWRRTYGDKQKLSQRFVEKENCQDEFLRTKAQGEGKAC